MSLDLVTEGKRAFEFLLSEASGQRSRKNVIIAASQTLPVAALLGKITQGARTAVGAAGTPAPAGATISASPTATLATVVGVHRFRCVTAGATGKWNHYGPAGDKIGIATTGTAYSGGGLGLTITDSGTDPAVGEELIVTVTAVDGSGQYVLLDPTAINGSQVCAGILGGDAVTTGVGETASAVVIDADAEVIGARLNYGSLDTTQKATARTELAAKGVVVR